LGIDPITDGAYPLNDHLFSKGIAADCLSITGSRKTDHVGYNNAIQGSDKGDRDGTGHLLGRSILASTCISPMIVPINTICRAYPAKASTSDFFFCVFPHKQIIPVSNQHHGFALSPRRQLP
jgi:hypothetical protein